MHLVRLGSNHGKHLRRRAERARVMGVALAWLGDNVGACGRVRVRAWGSDEGLELRGRVEGFLGCGVRVRAR